jgi:hypothetical protein
MENEKQSQEYRHYFLSHPAIVHKEIILAGQTVNSAYYCEVLWQLRENVLKLCQLTLVTKELAYASQRTVSHFFFHKEIFGQKQHDCCPSPILLV